MRRCLSVFVGAFFALAATTASAEPPKKPAPPAKKTAPPPAASGKRAADPAARRQIAGGPSGEDVMLGPDSAELRALRAAEHELFPIALPPSAQPDLPYPLAATGEAPRVHDTGLPPTPPPGAPPIAEGGRDISWLAKLELPDLPIRWDARLVRYLEFFKDDPRGRAMLTLWLHRSGRYRDMIRRTLRKKGLPEDLVWLAMIESGFEPTARSHAGALGMWQFMPDTGRLYGLSQDRWADQRMNVQQSTEAAAEFLADLHRRFGTWDLAIASYNMGYAGILAVVRRYNTNDFWALSRLEGALPWETTLYVPKILAAAIVAKNLGAFGFGDVQPDPPLEPDEVSVPPGTSLAAVAAGAGCSTKDIEALNPELRASRTPPAPPSSAPGAGAPAGAAGDYPVKVPAGKGAAVTAALAKVKKDVLEKYVVRFGETLEQIAQARRVSTQKLIELNGIAQGELVRGGTVLLVPKDGGAPTAKAQLAAQVPGSAAPPAPSAAHHADPALGALPGAEPIVTVPADVFVYPDRKRVFYRVLAGDTLPQIAGAFHVSVDELRRWNDLDPAARLQEGMTLQLFVAPDADLSQAIYWREPDVRVVTVGSEEFFAYHEGLKGKKRITVAAKPGDTLESIGRRYGVSPAVMERINRRSRKQALGEGETVALYVTHGATSGATPAAQTSPIPIGNGPLPVAPMPDLLPRLP